MVSAEQTIDERICQAKAEIEKAYIGWKEVKELERRVVEQKQMLFEKKPFVNYKI